MAYENFPTTVAAGLRTAGAAIPKPSRPLTEGVKSSVITFSADSGHEQRRVKSPPKRTFQLQYLALRKDEYITLRDFYIKNLTVYSFFWTHPIEKTQYLVKFSNDTFQGENISQGPSGPIYKLSLNLEQVWE